MSAKMRTGPRSGTAPATRTIWIGASLGALATTAIALGIYLFGPVAPPPILPADIPAIRDQPAHQVAPAGEIDRDRAIPLSPVSRDRRQPPALDQAAASAGTKPWQRPTPSRGGSKSTKPAEPAKPPGAFMQ